MDPVITYSQLRGQEEYVPGEIINNTHFGQRKLFLSELQFLTQELENNDEYCVVIYAGAAPGGHIPYLLKYFPNIEFVLVDPNHFNHNYYKRDYPNISIHNTTYSLYLNKQIKEEFRWPHSRYKLFFWSDIRTRTNDLDVIRDLCLQQLWIRELMPTSSMLKFRTPFYNPRDQIDFLQNYHKHRCFNRSDINYVSDYRNRKFRYLDGEIRLQAWARTNSAETRLIVRNPYLVKEYDVTDYEKKLYYYNKVSRVQHGQDDKLERWIWEEYSKKFTILDVDKEIEELHGYLEGNCGNR